VWESVNARGEWMCVNGCVRIGVCGWVCVNEVHDYDCLESERPHALVGELDQELCARAGDGTRNHACRLEEGVDRG
jgi:hypothetical protein